MGDNQNVLPYQNTPNELIQGSWNTCPGENNFTITSDTSIRIWEANAGWKEYPAGAQLWIRSALPMTYWQSCSKPTDSPPEYTPTPQDNISAKKTEYCNYAFKHRKVRKGRGKDDHNPFTTTPCPECGVSFEKCGLKKTPDLVADLGHILSPRFRFECHVPPTAQGSSQNLFCCWICWEMEKKWVKPMKSEEWWKHMVKHFTSDGYKVCTSVDKLMRRRETCKAKNCPKVHS